MASGTEIFRLFGSIFIDTSEAEKSLSKTDSKVKKLQESLGKAVTGAVKMAAGVAASVAGAGAAVSTSFCAAHPHSANAQNIAKTTGKTRCLIPFPLFLYFCMASCRDAYKYAC